MVSLPFFFHAYSKLLEDAMIPNLSLFRQGDQLLCPNGYSRNIGCRYRVVFSSVPAPRGQGRTPSYCPDRRWRTDR